MTAVSRKAQQLPLLIFWVAVAYVLAGSERIRTAKAAAEPGKLSTVTAIYVFGDSVFDVGNNNFLPGNRAKANFPHYGVDFPGGVATGRFTNGFNLADFLAQLLGYKMSPPPVLSLQIETAQVFRGVNFASGGSGILDVTGQNVSLSLNTQIKLFENLTVSLNKSLGPRGAELFLSKALFFFSVGSNDMFDYFSMFGPATNSTAKDEFVSLLAATYRSQLQKLYSLGARKFAVLGSAIIGCVPFFRALNPTGGCSDDLNDLSLRYNNVTTRLLKALSAELEGMKYSFTNSYQVLTDIVAKPLHFGHNQLLSACCGGGRFNAGGCTPNSTYCPNRRQYLFWDAVHPTEKTYRLIALDAIRGIRGVHDSHEHTTAGADLGHKSQNLLAEIRDECSVGARCINSLPCWTMHQLTSLTPVDRFMVCKQ